MIHFSTGGIFAGVLIIVYLLAEILSELRKLNEK